VQRIYFETKCKKHLRLVRIWAHNFEICLLIYCSDFLIYFENDSMQMWSLKKKKSEYKVSNKNDVLEFEILISITNDKLLKYSCWPGDVVYSGNTRWLTLRRIWMQTQPIFLPNCNTKNEPSLFLFKAYIESKLVTEKIE
jgi:hypothetical protein